MFGAVVSAVLAAGAFSPGEQTSYEVSWLGLTAGTATLTVGWPTRQQEREVWPLVCFGQTASLAAVYKVKDRFTSYWDPVAQLPVGADFLVDESREHRRDRFRYDRAGGQILLKRQREGEPIHEAGYELPDGVMDLASAGFGLRNTPLTEGLERTVPIFTGAKVYSMLIRVEGRAHLTTRLGELDVWRVTVNGDFNGKLATKGRITLFYTADARQLPVRAEADLLLGTVALDVTAYEPGVGATP